MMRGACLGLALFVATPAALACELPGGKAQTLRSGGHTVVYRSAPPRIGEHFAVEFAVCPAPESVRVDAWMPEHRHGMNYRAKVSPQGDGRFLAEGLMFHMPGRWQFVFDVESGGKRQRLTKDVVVE